MSKKQDLLLIHFKIKRENKSVNISRWNLSITVHNYPLTFLIKFKAKTIQVGKMQK